MCTAFYCLPDLRQMPGAATNKNGDPGTTGIATAQPSSIRGRRASLLGDFRSRKHADVATQAALIFEANDASNTRKKRIVLTLADVQPRLVPGASLANQNCSCIYQLTGETLATEALSLRIAAVYG